MEKTMLSVADASELLQFHRNIIYELFQQGEIEGYQRRRGTKILLYRDSVLDYREKISNAELS